MVDVDAHSLADPIAVVLAVEPGDFTSDGLIVGGAGLLAFLFRAYFREVKRKDEGVWDIVDALNRQIENERIEHARELAAMTDDRDYYRAKLLGKPVDEHHRKAITE